MFIRQDAWSLQPEKEPWDPILLAYAYAVRKMRERPDDDPTSWAYQANIHGTARETPPGAKWNQCQHGSWHFLPWHRMYIYYFERLIRALMPEVGGPEDWALPYWNYGRGDATVRALPPAFREVSLPDGSPNPLLVANRGDRINDGLQLTPKTVDAEAALAFINFAPNPPPGFGGVRLPPTQFQRYPGKLESYPHNVIHDGVGGLMGHPRTAAQDPIFWLHHSNIDRLWVHWIRSGGGRANPSEKEDWLDISFDFYDERGQLVKLTSADVLDTGKQLEYRYDIELPAVSRTPVPGAYLTRAMSPPAREEAEEELVAASEEPVQLTGRSQAMKLPLPEVARRTALRAAANIDDEQVYLRVEGLDTENDHNVVYGVYVGLPSELGDGERADDYFVGLLSFFGASQQRDIRAPGDGPPGLTYTFDITALVQDLQQRQRWNDDELTVTFVPEEPTMPDGEVVSAARPDLPDAKIGRVSLFRVPS